MANTWFVDRDGEEKGPLTAQQLKTMAENGAVKPTDLVRTEEAKDWRLASSVKGLFPRKESTPRPMIASPPREPMPKGPPTTPVIENVALIAASVVCCFPVGLVLVWLHPTWSKGRKWALTGVVAVVFLGSVIVGGLGRAADQKTLAEADTLWNSGNKVSAVAKYRSVLYRLHGEEQALPYSRVIDFAFESGQGDEGKRLLIEADKKGVVLLLSSDLGKRALAERKAEAARAGAEKEKKEQEGSSDSSTKFTVSKGTFSGNFVFRVLVPDEITVSDPTFDHATLTFRLHWRNSIGRPRDPWHFSVYGKNDVKLDGGAVEIPSTIKLGQTIKANVILQSEDIKEITRIDIHQ